jgi:hypothetical protein
MPVSVEGVKRPIGRPRAKERPVNFQTVTLRAAAALALSSSAFFGAVPATAATSATHRDIHSTAYRVTRVVSLVGYTEAHATGFGPSDSIAGDAVLNGARLCLLWSTTAVLNISPGGFSVCRVDAVSKSGTIVGRVGTGTKTQGFVYKDGRSTVVPSAASFFAVNSAGLALGVKQDGSRGVYDTVSDTWPVFQDLGRGCGITRPIALNDHYVFGAATCADGSAKYGLADSGHYLSLSLPGDLRPSSILTSADQLVLFDPRAAGHTYLWRVWGGRPPQDLGNVPNDVYGTYTPVAANPYGTVVGENRPQFFSWVRTPLDGTRDLGALILPGNFFGLSVADVDDAGNVLAQAFDFDTSGSQVWMILQPSSS